MKNVLRCQNAVAGSVKAIKAIKFMAINSTNPAIWCEIFEAAYFACIGSLGLYETVHDDDRAFWCKNLDL